MWLPWYRWHLLLAKAKWSSVTRGNGQGGQAKVERQSVKVSCDEEDNSKDGRQDPVRDSSRIVETVKKEKAGEMFTFTNMGRGTGIGALIPICPASITFSNLRPVAPDCVKIDAPLPSASTNV